MSGKMKLFSVEYYGTAVMDKRFSKPMLPWIIAEIKRRNISEKICLGVQDGFVFAFNFDLNAGQDPIYRHELNLITRFSHSYESHCLFMYLLRDSDQGETLSCHLYRAEEDNDVVELFTAMKEQSWKETSMAAPLNARTQSNAAQLTTLCADISPSSSHFFEVFYIGKIKVSHKKVPESFIDDALEKFKTHELEKERQKNLNPPPGSMIGKSTSSYTLSASNSNGSLANNTTAHAAISKSQSNNSISNGSLAKSQSNNAIAAVTTSDAATPGTEWPPAEIGENGEVKPEVVDSIQGASSVVLSLRRASQDLPEVSLSPMRERAMSTGSSGSAPSLSDHNRTMLFLVGRTDVRLISPDRKQVLLHKSLRDIAKCIQGVQHAEHFGFLCREPADGFVGFVFRCQSAGFADDVVAAVSQAFNSSTREPVTSCEHCPMMWYHRLCAEIEGKPDGRTQAILCRRVEMLPEDEQAMICGRLSGAEPTSVREQNELLMSLLRLHCEQKQTRHSHDTAESRSEFLNQYLGGSGTIFMKAKRSLTSSFDQLLKRKGSRDDFGPIKELSLPGNSTLGKEQNASSSMGDVSDPPQQTSSRTRKRSSTIGSLDGENIKREFSRQYAAHPANGPINCLGNSGSNTSLGKEKPTPMMDIFMKVGNQAKIASNDLTSSDTSRQSGSWRQAIYNRVVTPTKNETVAAPVVKRDKKELRSLWKKAINQQLILIRMEKENARLTARQEEATVKRIKLEYDEISSCMRQVSEVWELLISRESRVSAKCDTTMLLQAIKQGVPRSKRGDVWQFLAEQHCLKLGPIDVANFPSYATPYESLLKQLTSHQHGILIDLGRTFPQHAYFSSPLGPGQLALFNLLKAYSLLDPEVGYCQGLSFVAGVLLLHMAEAQAFFLLRHLMFRRGLRKQYLPDMGALQVQLYQLSRLLHDQLPEVVAHFNCHDVAPTLYAAPWLLTIFASQFPLGFVTRVFDLLFLFGPEVVFRVAVALLTEHKDGLLACAGFEDIMDYLKVTLPDISKPLLDRVMKQVFAMDVSRQLREYEVEYQVLQEESARPDPQQLEMLELENSQLATQNSSLAQQLQISNGAVKKLEQTRTSQTAQIARLESSVRGLEVSVFALGSFLAQLADTRPDIELPGDIRRIVGQLEVAQRRQSLSKQSTGLPLRVINDTQDSYYVPEKTQSNAEATVRAQDRRHPLKTALSSPNLSLKLQGFFQSNKVKRDADIGDARIAKADKSGEPKESLDQQVSSSEDAKIRKGVDLLPSPEVTLTRPPLKSSQSSFELGSNKCVGIGEGDSGHVTPISPMTPSAHPLSCSGVSFSYQGTTKLKSLRSGRGLGRSHESIRGSEGELVSIDEGKGETAR